MTWFDGDVYLQVRLHRGWQLRVVKATQREPDVIQPGCVVVKIALRMPGAAFSPIQPRAVVTVPEELVQHLIHVEAVDPT